MTDISSGKAASMVRLAELQADAVIQFKLQGDAAYRTDTHLTSGHKDAAVSDAQKREKESMSKAREYVEWGFGKIANEFAFCDFKKNPKVSLQPVGRIHYVSETSIHVCTEDRLACTFKSFHRRLSRMHVRCST
jgi:hypothetical protein